MRKNKLKQMTQPIVNAWLSIPSSYSAEVIAHQGYDSVTVDMQHGMIDFASAVTMLQAISTSSAIPLARVINNNEALIMQLLDAGAYGIICPMISTVEDAKRFVSACRYPPMGERSFGPARGVLYGGNDYILHANQEILALAMIETPEGVANIEEILQVEGLDGIYVGPNDLSLLMVGAPQSESDHPEVIAAIEKVVKATHKAGKMAGVFCSSAQAAKQRIAQGFHLVTPGNDVIKLKKASQDAVALIRGASTGTGDNSY